MAAGDGRRTSGDTSRSGDKRPAIWGPRQVEAARPLLFERLTGIAGESDDDHLEEGAYYDRDELIASIERELGALFNTRAPVAAEVLAQRKRTTIDYGIPDLSHYAPGDPAAREALARDLLGAIAAFEPRLIQPRVTVLPHPTRERLLVAAIEGNIRLDTIVEHVSFRIELANGAGQNDGG